MGASPPAGASKGQLGYLRLATFNSNTVAKAREALEALRGQGVEGIVLDIRNNGGGLFPAGGWLAQETRGVCVGGGGSHGVEGIVLDIRNSSSSSAAAQQQRVCGVHGWRQIWVQASAWPSRRCRAATSC